MKTLICYKTKGGATKQYCQWLADDTKADLKEFGEVGRRFDFSDYDQIVVSSGTYAGLMPLNRFLKRQWKKLGDKKVIVMAVGAAPADDKWSLWSFNRIPEKIRTNIEYFKLMGEVPQQGRPANYKSQVKKEYLKPILVALKK